MRDERKDPGYLPLMPYTDLSYLIGYLWKIGPLIETAMGTGPLNHVDLAAWQSNSGIELAPWEADFMRQLSREYLALSQQAKKSDCPPPWLGGLSMPERRIHVAKKIDAIFG